MGTKIVLITGATGFIGRHFCKSAQERGLQVIALTRSIEKAGALLPGVQLIETLEDLPITKKINYLVNLAGEPLVAGRWNEARKQEFINSRVGTTDSLFKYFESSESPPDVLISGSAVGYYGNQGDKQLDDSARHQDSYSHRLCSEWERSAAQFTRLGTRVCYLRTGIVLGLGEGALGRMVPPFKLGLGGRIGSGKQWMPWIHINDEVALIYHCLRRSDISGSVNACAPNPVTNRQFSQILAGVLSRPALLPMPAPVVRLLFGEMADELLLAGQRAYPRKSLESGFEFSFPELRQALEEILK